MKATAMIPSKYLKKEDVEPPVLVTIKGLRQNNVALEDQPEELKWTIFFRELDKPMVLNSTNIQLLVKCLGTDETDDWAGKQVVLYNDPNVSFAGKITGGIRVRAPRVKTEAPKPTDDPNEMDIPF